MKLASNDKLIGGCLISNGQGKLILARAETGNLLEVQSSQVRLVSRGNKGNPIIKKGQLVLVPPNWGAPEIGESTTDTRA